MRTMRAGLVECDPDIGAVQSVAITLVTVVRRHGGPEHGTAGRVRPVAVSIAGRAEDVCHQGGSQPARVAAIDGMGRSDNLPCRRREPVDAGRRRLHTVDPDVTVSTAPPRSSTATSLVMDCGSRTAPSTVTSAALRRPRAAIALGPAACTEPR